jgi:hypothetical protein
MRTAGLLLAIAAAGLVTTVTVDVAPARTAAGFKVASTLDGKGAVPPTNGAPVVIPYQFSLDCAPYGFAFSNIVQGVQTDRFQTWSDATGNPVKVVDHGKFVETDTNSVTNKQLSFTQNWIQTFDLVAGTRTVVGKAFVMTDPGKGIVIHDTGRVVFDAPEHVAFVAGQHQVLYGDIDQLACTALNA